MSATTHKNLMVVDDKFVDRQLLQAERQGIRIEKQPGLVKVWSPGLELVFSALRVGATWQFCYDPKFYSKAA